jgi:chromosome segregation ATPase
MRTEEEIGELEAQIEDLQEEIEGLKAEIDELKDDLSSEEFARREALGQLEDVGGDQAREFYDTIIDAARQLGNTYLGPLNDVQSVAEALQHGAIKLVKA